MLEIMVNPLRAHQFVYIKPIDSDYILQCNDYTIFAESRATATWRFSLAGQTLFLTHAIDWLKSLTTHGQLDIGRSSRPCLSVRS